jgi:hypothetical protein
MGLYLSQTNRLGDAQIYTSTSNTKNMLLGPTVKSGIKAFWTECKLAGNNVVLTTSRFTV